MGMTAIFGGTFNPFHNAHLLILQSLQNDKRVDKILLTPDKVPPHKICDFLASDDDRIEMCKLMADKFSKVSLCLDEFNRNGKSYSYDTVVELKRKNPDTSFAFICGGDMLVSFEKWYNYKELLKLLPFIVYRRVDTSKSIFEEKLTYLSSLGMNIIVMEDLLPDISSTYIRNNINKSEELLPPEIYNYIIKKRIYNA